MNHSKIAVRYAKALFSLSKEEGMLEPVYADVRLIDQTCIDAPEFLLFLQSPIVKPSEKQKLMQALFTGKIQELTMKFLVMVAQNKREHHLRDISRYFLDLYKAEKGIKTVVLTSASKIEEAEKKQLIELIKNTYKKEVEMNEVVDDQLIGGFILRLDDQQYDSSVATLLKKLKQEMISKALEN